MAITSTSQTRSGNATVVTVVSDLTPPVFYHWYVDGAYVGVTTSGTKAFYFERGDVAEIDVTDTTDANFDAIANAPARFPARQSVWWIRSLASGVSHYRIEMTKSGGASGNGSFFVARVDHDPDRWSYRFLSARLEDQATYSWKVYSVDSSGLQDNPLLVLTSARKLRRKPDAPRFSIAYDAGTDKITFSEVAA